MVGDIRAKVFREFGRWVAVTEVCEEIATLDNGQWTKGTTWRRCSQRCRGHRFKFLTSIEARYRVWSLLREQRIEEKAGEPKVVAYVRAKR